MSEQEKGEIVAKMASLPPMMQAMAEGFVHGLAAAAKRDDTKDEETSATEGQKKKGDPK